MAHTHTIELDGSAYIEFIRAMRAHPDRPTVDCRLRIPDGLRLTPASGDLVVAFSGDRSVAIRAGTLEDGVLSAEVVLASLNVPELVQVARQGPRVEPEWEGPGEVDSPWDTGAERAAASLVPRPAFERTREGWVCWAEHNPGPLGRCVRGRGPTRAAALTAYQDAI